MESMLANVFFSWLWRSSWHASVLVAIVLVVQRLLRSKLSPAWNYALWFLVVARLCLPVAPPSALSVFNYAQVGSAGEPSMRLWLGLEDSGRSGETAGSSVASSVELGQSANWPGVGEASGGTPERSGLPSWSFAVFSARVQRVLAWVWLAGFTVIAARLVIGNHRFTRRLRRRKRLTDPGVLSVLEECKAAMRVSRMIDVIETPDVDSPALFGCFRLRLLLPHGLAAKFSRDELRHVFLHELAHVRRGDVWVNWLTTILQTLHWFNPALWFGFSRMRADREVACDALALSCAREGESQSYGQTIIKLLAGLDRPALLPGMVGILEDKRQMKRRIAMIAKFKRPARWSVLVALPIIVLGLITLTDAQTKKERADKEIIAEIERLGGKIQYHEMRLDRPVISVSFYREDWDVAFRFPDVTDDTMGRLGNLTELQELALSGDSVTDEGLRHLKGLTKLKKLNLFLTTKITGTGLQYLKAARNLTSLEFGFNRSTTDAVLAILKDFPNLEYVWLNANHKITDAGLKQLAVLKNLRDLHLGNTPITDTGLANLRDLGNLQKLEIWRTKVTDDGLKHLQTMLNLEELIASETRIGDSGIAFVANLSKLRHLNIRRTSVTDAGLAMLKGLPGLAVLEIGQTQITEAGLVHLKDFAKLQEVHLQGPRQVTDAALGHLTALPNLQKVRLDGGDITEVGLLALRTFQRLEIGPWNYMRAFTLSGPTITDSSLIHLQQLAQVATLSFKETRVTGAGLVHLKAVPGLKDLNLSGTEASPICSSLKPRLPTKVWRI